MQRLAVIVTALPIPAFHLQHMLVVDVFSLLVLLDRYSEFKKSKIYLPSHAIP